MEDFEHHAIMARRLERNILLDKVKATKESNKYSVFIITTFHPSDHNIREVVHKNWDILVQSPTTDSLFQKKLVVGYRRPKNLRDLLVCAAIPRLATDNLVDPNYKEPVMISATQVTSVITGPLNIPIRRHSNITEFFQPKPQGVPTSAEVIGTNQVILPREIKPR